MRPKSVALIVAGALTTGWLLASLVWPPVAKLQVLSERAQPAAKAHSANEEPTYTEQLHFKAGAAPAVPVPRRNPFVFGGGSTRAASASGRDAEAGTTAKVTGDVAQLPVGPSLQLSGIGTTKTADGIVRTAVLLSGTEVRLAKVKDIVAGYVILEITDDSVKLADAAGAEWLLRLR